MWKEAFKFSVEFNVKGGGVIKGSKIINWKILTSQVLHGDYNLLTDLVSEKLFLNFSMKYSHVALFTWSSYEPQHKMVVNDHVFTVKLIS